MLNEHSTTTYLCIEHHNLKSPNPHLWLSAFSWQTFFPFSLLAFILSRRYSLTCLLPLLCSSSINEYFTLPVLLEISRCQWRTWAWTVMVLWGCIVTLSALKSQIRVDWKPAWMFLGVLAAGRASSHYLNIRDCLSVTCSRLLMKHSTFVWYKLVARVRLLASGLLIDRLGFRFI